MEPFPFSILKRRGKLVPRGFTLIEMLVVLAIIVIITAIALSGQTGFSRTLALQNATYDIALSIRQAQSLGLSNQAFGTIGNAGYGVAFSTSPGTSYVLFADTYPPPAANAQPDAKPGNHEYDAGQSELVQTYALNNGFALGKMCVYPSSGSHVCSGAGGLTNLDITFIRPNIETFIAGQVTGTWNTSYTGACLTLVSPQNDSRTVTVSQTGQVALVTTPCQ